MSSLDAGIDLGKTFGPVYWGFVISLFLGGVTCVQAYLYFPTSTDRPLVKATAFNMLILDLVSSALVAQSIYYYLLPHFGSTLPLNSVTPELSAECLLSTIITLVSQLYFAYQLFIVRHLGKSSWLFLGAITTFAFLAFAGGVACVVSMYIFHHGVLSNRNHIFAIFFGFAKGFGALADIVATIAMSLFLKSSRTGMEPTNKMLDHLLQFIIQRGFLVTLIQVLLLITFYALPNSLCWFAFHVNVTKLYANTFFAMLNGRDRLKQTVLRTATPYSSRTATLSNLRNKTMDDQYQLSNLESQEPKAFAMPTVTRTVVIADL